MIRMIITSLIIGLVLMYSCQSAPDYSDVPEITFGSFSKSQMNQGSLNNDSVTLTITFTDGDGDLGSADNERNLFLIDKRTGQVYDRFRTPFIPEEGTGNGITGTIRINLFNTCCVFPDNIPPCESPDLYPTNDLTFEVYIVDRAGNQSNVIETQPITLLYN